MTVFREFYEVVGAATDKARAFAAERAAAFDAQWKIVKALGADGFRPGHGGGIKSLLFKPDAKLPAGLRKVGRDLGMIEYQPSRNTKAGKAICAELYKAPTVQEWGKFANEFGWKGRSPMGSVGGRGYIYYASGVHVLRPVERFFLQLPRELNDGWTIPEGLKEVRESDMLRAIEDHNATIKKRKAA